MQKRYENGTMKLNSDEKEGFEWQLRDRDAYTEM